MDTLVSCTNLVRDIAGLVQTAADVNERCETLGHRVGALQPLLNEVLEQVKAGHGFSENDKKGFIQLRAALDKAKTVLKDVCKVKGNKLKLLWMASSLNDDLAKVSADIQECLCVVQLTHVGISINTRELVKETASRLTELVEELKRKSAEAADQRKSLERETLDRIKRHGQAWAGSGPSAFEVLAEHLGVEVESVKTDLKELNKSSESKALSRQVDDKSQQDLLDEMFQQLLMVMAELERKGCPNCNPKDIKQCPMCLKAAISLKQAKDLHCTICLAVFKAPVILPSGYTFCRKCIEESWEKSGTKLCPITRLPSHGELIPNRGIEQLLLSLPTKGQEKPRQVQALAEAAQEFLDGNQIDGSLALRYHSQSLEGRKKIVATPGLIDAILEFAASTTCAVTVDPTLQILEVLTGPDPNGSSLSVEELNTVWPHFKKDRLQALVAHMAGSSGGTESSGLLAAMVVFNVIHGSEKCLYLARTSLTDLVKAFFRMAVAGQSGSAVRSTCIGLKGLSLLADVDYKADDSSMVSYEKLLETLATLVSRRIAFDESVAAIASLLKSSRKGICHVVQASDLISRFSTCGEAGKDAVVKVLRCISDETTLKGEDADSEVWGKPLMRANPEAGKFVQGLLELISSTVTGNVEQCEGLDDAIFLLRFLFTHSVCAWALKPDEGAAEVLLKVLSGKRASSQARIATLDIVLHLTASQNQCRSEWHTQFMNANGVAALCSIVQSNQESLCRLHSAIVLERLVHNGDSHGGLTSSSTDDTNQRLMEMLSLEKLDRFMGQGGRADEGKVATAVLMSLILTGQEAEDLKIRCMDYLVYVLGSVEQNQSKIKAAEALAHFIRKSVEVAVYWIVRPQGSHSGVNVLTELVQVTLKSLDWPSTRVVCESLALVCTTAECHQYVIQAEGHLLFQKALTGGIHSPAIWTALAALLASDASCSSQGGSILDEGVRAMALKLPSTKEVAMVKAFMRLCDEPHTGRSVVKPTNGATKMLLDIVKSCETNSAAAKAAARGLAKLAALDDGCRLDLLLSKSSREEGYLDVLVDVGKRCLCVEAVEALFAVSENAGAAQDLANRIPDLMELVRKDGRLQEVALEIIWRVSFIKNVNLPASSIANLLSGNHLPDLLLKLLQRPSHPSATTAIRIVHNLCQDSADFRAAMCSDGHEVVTPLLRVMENPTSLSQARDFSVLALERFMTPECNGRKWLLRKDNGLDLVLAVLQRTGELSYKVSALKILRSLAEPAITPSSEQKRVWDKIVGNTSPVFQALAQTLDVGERSAKEAAVWLITCCVQQARNPKSVCRLLQEANVCKPLVQFLAQEPAVEKVVKLLSSKNSNTKQLLNSLIREMNAERQAAMPADE